MVHDDRLHAGERQPHRRRVERPDLPRRMLLSGHEAELRGAEVLPDHGIRRPSAGRGQRLRIQLLPRADDCTQSMRRLSGSQGALGDQAQHRRHGHHPGDALGGDRRTGRRAVEARQDDGGGAGVQALGESVEIHARRQRAGHQHPVLAAQVEMPGRGLEGASPGAAAAQEPLGHRGGAGGQAHQEGGVVGPVAQVCRCCAFREHVAAALAHRAADALGQSRIQDRAHAPLGHPRGPSHDELRAGALLQDPDSLP